jgi:glycolate oxidase FAD binding subunit
MGTDLAGALADACDAVRPGDAADHVSGVVPRFVATPATVQQLAAVLGAAHACKAAVCAAGAGSALQVGRPPRALDVLLRTSALDQVLDHSPADLRVSAQAGVRLRALQRQLAGHRQRLALDPPRDGSLGGIVATNAAGALRHRYGSPRDLLIGVRLALADGSLAKAGGTVVKNVAGYDLCKLVTGSYGTLAVVVEVTLRLHQIPAAAQWLRHPLGGGDHLRALLAGYEGLRVEPTALELDADLDTGAGTLHALLEGTADGVAARVAQSRAALGGEPVAASVAVDGQPPEFAGDGRSGGTGPADDLVVQVVVAPAGVAALLDGLRGHPALPPGSRLRGRAGVGVLSLSVPSVRNGAAELLAAVRELAGRYDGTAVVLRQPSGAGLDVWGPVRGLALMRRVKEQFDPGGVLTPGRFVGGI